MLRKLLFLFVALVFTTPLFAQRNVESKERHEISVSYGAYPTTGWLSNFNKSLIGAFIGVASEGTDWGAVTVGYGYRLTSHFTLGAQVVYASGVDTYTFFDVSSKANNSYLTVMPSVKMAWFNKGVFSMYSRVGAGITFVNSKTTFENENLSESRATFGYQFSPIGLEVGGAVAGYVEAGFGMSGSLIAGVRCRF